MKRDIVKNLKIWKEDPNRKPLVLLGARQVGKTYILKAFGKSDFKSVAYLNCDNNEDVKALFHDYDTTRIIRGISALTNVEIIAGETLIILDEIQEVQNGLGALKYFCEDAPEYHIAVAGSLLGITMHPNTSFPVGKVDFLQLGPMSFSEFLIAMGKETAVELLQHQDWHSINTLKNMFVELLRQYYFVGGMPEVVKSYTEHGDIWKVRELQLQLIQAYKNDISKHAPSEQVKRINLVLESIPAQLSRENRKFVYSALRKGARAADFELSIQWLCDAGLVHKITRVQKPTLPLKFYEDFNAFKLYLMDCGLLTAMANVPPKEILLGESVFEEFKGAFTENFVLQQLKTIPTLSIFYYSNSSSTQEIDFLIQDGATIYPVEVKAEENLRSKSLRQFVLDHPELKGVRLSMSPYREQEWMQNIPLYASAYFFKQTNNE